MTISKGNRPKKGGLSGRGPASPRRFGERNQGKLMGKEKMK